MIFNTYFGHDESQFIQNKHIVLSRRIKSAIIKGHESKKPATFCQLLSKLNKEEESKPVIVAI